MKKMILFILILATHINAQVPKHVFDSPQSDTSAANLIKPSHWDDYLKARPDTAFCIYDEFFTGSTAGNLGFTITNLGGGGGGPASTIVTGVPNHPGIIQISTGTNSGHTRIHSLGPTTTLGGINPVDNFDITWVILPSTAADTIIIRAGIDSSAALLQPADGIYFEKILGDVNWFGITRAGGTETRTNTNQAFAAAWVRLRLRRVNSTTIGFQINNTTEVTATANIPTRRLIPFILVSNGNSGLRTVQHDFFHCLITGLER